MYSPIFPENKLMSSLEEILAGISRKYHTKYHTEKEPPLSDEEKQKILRREKSFKKLICPFCFSEVETLTEDCPTCKAIEQLKKGENQ